MASSKAKTPDPTPQEIRLVYVGPNMGGDMPMQQFTTFKDGLPPAVAARRADDPDFACLFVPVSGLSTAREALGRKGSPMQRAFESVWNAYAATRRKEGK